MFSIMFKFFFIIIMFTGLICQISEKNYKIYSTKLDKEVTLNDIILDMKNMDVLFYGEEHNDSVTHYLEYQILSMLEKEYKSNVTLSLEMFDRDVQQVMKEYLSGTIREKHFLKDARVWSNYKDYRPLIELAKLNKFDVICANGPTRYSNVAGRLGIGALQKLDPIVFNYFAPLPFDTATGAYHDKLMPISKHETPVNDTVKKVAPMLNMMGSFNLILAQSLWDATMAYSISDYLSKNKGKKIFQVNGRFHSDEGFAVVTQLKKYKKDVKTLIISSGPDDSFPNIDWSKFKHLGDYIIITDPTIPRTYKEAKG